MPRTAEFDRQGLALLLRKQYGVIAREQALACGMSQAMIRYRSRDKGPWRLLAPGVYLTGTGGAGDDQRDMAALLYAGRGSVLTGQAALRRHGAASAAPAGAVDVLVSRGNRRQDAGFVRLHRSSVLPARICVAGEIRFALPPRAVADAARSMTDLREVRGIVASAVQRGICPIPRLAEELAAGPIQGSARLRQAVAEVADGIRSVAEADLRDLIKRAGLPPPMFNPRLFAGDDFIAMPDCWWPDAGVAVEVDSREWHLSPRDWERTLARHARMGGYGIVVLHFTPGQIRAKHKEVVSAVRAALAAGHGRLLPGIRAVPAE